MNGTTYDPLSTTQASSAGSATVVTVTVPSATRAMLIGVETNDARVTFDGSAPAAGNGLLFKAGLQPVLVPISGGPTVTLKFASSQAAAASLLDVAFLA